MALQGTNLCAGTTLGLGIAVGLEPELGLNLCWVNQLESMNSFSLYIFMLIFIQICGCRTPVSIGLSLRNPRIQFLSWSFVPDRDENSYSHSNTFGRQANEKLHLKKSLSIVGYEAGTHSCLLGQWMLTSPLRVFLQVKKVIYYGNLDNCSNCNAMIVTGLSSFSAIMTGLYGK